MEEPKERKNCRKHGRNNDKTEYKSKSDKEFFSRESKRRRNNDYDKSSNHSSRERRYESEHKRYEKLERYWEKDTDQSHRNKDMKAEYLVGSRYYNEPSQHSLVKSLEGPNKSKENVNPLESTGREKQVSRKKNDDIITSRTGGAYIPPGKLKLMQASITDKSR